MNFLFRVDAGGKIGLGHFFRSVNLAKKLTNRGHTVRFVHQPSLFWNKQKEAHFQFEAFEKNELNTELKIIKTFKIDKLFVDGIIHFDVDYIKEIKLYVEVIFYQNISDSKFLADNFILPSIHQGPSFFKSFSTSTKIYQGLEYFTFSESIESLPKKDYIEKVKNIGVIAGGSDPKNTLEKLLSIVMNLKLDNVTFTFFYGVDSSFDKILSSYKLKNSNIKGEQYDPFKILCSDLLISAFGVSTYEFMALGMPIISYGHQQANAEAANYLSKHTEALCSLGLIDDLNEDKLLAKLNELINDPDKINKLSKTAKNTFDFKGIERVIKILEYEKR